MNAIFAYKNLDKFWKVKDELYWKIAKLSVDNAAKFYTTVLYADDKTYSLFQSKGIKFDVYKNSTDLFKDVTEHCYAMPKILVAIEQKEPYILLDLDTVLFSKISSTKMVCYGHKEIYVDQNKPIEDKLLDVQYLEEYYSRPYNKVGKSFGVKVFDWVSYPSNSLLLVNAPAIVSEIYKKIVNELKREIYTIPPPLTMQFYEQFLFYNILKQLKVDYEFIYDKPTWELFPDNVGVFDILSIKYLHLDRYDRDSEIKKIVKILEKTL